ncbi:MAG: aminomethyl-transferring glycine dehydrogenase subunit GcvPA [Acidilobaceae archaeon]
MTHPWIPNSVEYIKKEMLKVIGVDSVEELYSDIPESIRISRDKWDMLPIGFGRSLSEIEVYRHMEDLFSRISSPRIPPFMGGGVWPHYVPEAIKSIIFRGEFLTAYTPYQAEISQGLMQALFEYQSLVAELLEMEVVNCSMYDWSSALGESLLMAMRVTGRKKFLVPETMNPMHKSVAETYIWPHNGRIIDVSVDRETGYIDTRDLESKISDDIAAVYIEYPHFTGVVDVNVDYIGELAHRFKALYIMGVEPISMAILKPPGALGADIAIGEGQPLGLGLNYGGPYLGIFATRWDRELVRQMPGRIIGLTTTIDGSEKAFAMILQTREQHIRRAKATSNITTNEALMAIASAVYISLLGRDGLIELAKHIWYKSHYAAKRLSELRGVESPLLKGEFIIDFTVRLPVSANIIRSKLKERGIIAGIPLGGHAWFRDSDILMTVTEVHSKSDIDMLVEAIKTIIEV